MDKHELRSYLFDLDWRRAQAIPEDSLASTLRGAAIRATIIVDAIIAAARWLESSAVAVAEFHESMYYAGQRNHALVSAMQAFDKTVANLGGTADDAQRSIEGFAYNLRSNVGYYSLLTGLGVNIKDKNGKTRDTVALLIDLGAVLSRMTYQNQVQYAALFGIDEQTLRAIADPDFANGVQRYKAIVQAGGFDPEASAKAWAEFNNAFRDLLTVIDLMMDKIMTAFVAQFGDAFKVSTQYLIDNSDAITDLILGVIDNIAYMVRMLWGSAGGMPAVWALLRRGLHAFAVVIEWIRKRFIGIVDSLLYLKRKTSDFERGAGFIYDHPLAALGLFGEMAAEGLGLAPSRAPSNIADIPSLFDDNGLAPPSVYGRNRITAGPMAGTGGSSAPPVGGGGTIPEGGVATAKKLAAHLMAKYGLTREQAIGAVGVMAYESGNFKTMQEKAQSGTKSGYGFAQWTGPRRTQFFAWAKANGLDPNSYEANEGFLDFELSTSKKTTIAALKKTGTARDAAYQFEYFFEGMREGGPGVPAFEQHMNRADALDRALPRALAPAPAASVASPPPAPSGQVVSYLFDPDVAKEAAPIVNNRTIDRTTHIDIKGATDTADAVKTIARHQAAVNAEMARAATESIYG